MKGFIFTQNTYTCLFVWSAYQPFNLFINHLFLWNIEDCQMNSKAYNKIVFNLLTLYISSKIIRTLFSEFYRSDLGWCNLKVDLWFWDQGSLEIKFRVWYLSKWKKWRIGVLSHFPGREGEKEITIWPQIGGLWKSDVHLILI